jgi:hypothetical protein
VSFADDPSRASTNRAGDVRRSNRCWFGFAYVPIFDSSQPSSSIRISGWMLLVPWWAFFTAIVLQLGVGLWIHAWFARRRWRALRNLCLKCGYDLRATPERCPECGTVARLVVKGAG